MNFEIFGIPFLPDDRITPWNLRPPSPVLTKFPWNMSDLKKLKFARFFEKVIQ